MAADSQESKQHVFSSLRCCHGGAGCRSPLCLLSGQRRGCRFVQHNLCAALIGRRKLADAA